MPVLVKHNGKFYEISDEVLAKSAISKAHFEAGIRKVEDVTRNQVDGHANYRFVEFSDGDFDEV